MFGKFLGGGGSKKQQPPPSKKANAFGVDPALFEDPKFEEDDEVVDLPEGIITSYSICKLDIDFRFFRL
jgi:hypothetical protein